MNRRRGLHDTRQEHRGLPRGDGVELAGKPTVPALRAFVPDWGQAVGAGFLATAMSAMSIKSLDVPALLGSMALPQGGPNAALIGTIWHFANGIAFALVYAKVLAAWQRQSTLGTGAGFGLVLWVVAMLLLPVLLSVHPLVRAGKMPNPGVFLLGLGAGLVPAVSLLIGHLVYGVLAGALYKHRVQGPKPDAVRMIEK